MKKAILCLALATAGIVPAQAALIISEVSPTGSSAPAYLADWFELTNTGAVALDITNWRMDDNSNSFAVSVPLSGVTSIAPGQSVVFIEGTSATADSFKTAWFGTNVPAGFTIGSYTGSGVGLSATSDAVNIFNSTGTLMANVSFNAATLGVSFDNAAGLNNATISTLSSVGTNGAFTSATGGEVGSPGTIGVVPEPSAFTALLGGLGVFGLCRRRRAA
jgi:hypothetical protein